MHEPSIERDHGKGDVESAGPTLLGENAVVDVPVGSPVEVRVIEEERSADWRRLPRRWSDLAQEMDQRQKGQKAPRSEKAEQRGILPQGLWRQRNLVMAPVGLERPGGATIPGRQDVVSADLPSVGRGSCGLG